MSEAEDFREWLFACNFEFASNYDRYGYSGSHGFVFVSGEELLHSQVMENIKDLTSGDVEASLAWDSINGNKEIFVGIDPDPVVALFKCQAKLAVKWADSKRRLKEKESIE